jgi:hypothetical protein
LSRHLLQLPLLKKKTKKRLLLKRLKSQLLLQKKRKSNLNFSLNKKRQLTLAFFYLSFLTNTLLRRSQLYLRLRDSGSQSASSGSNPLLMNQCMVRVVSTKILSKPM